MLVLDDKYVVTEESIEGMKFTLPENYIWCLTHMTTSGKEHFTNDSRFHRLLTNDLNVKYTPGVCPGFCSSDYKTL